MKKVIDEFMQKKLEKCAEFIVKYQKFKTNFVLEKLYAEGINLARPTLFNYVNYGIAYILYGKKSRAIPENLYRNIDRFIETHLQPLTPSEENKRRIVRKKYTEKDTILPIEKIPEVKAKITENFEYGVKIDNRIILFQSEENMEQFIKNLKFVNPEIELKAVTVSYDKLW